MGLFMLGEFVLNSGKKSAWKIDADALTNADIEALAAMIRQLTIGSFGWVSGVPRGGLRLAKALEKYITADATGGLICDDVLTSGNSMELHRMALGKSAFGVVIFARGQCPLWVTALFQLPQSLWV